METDGLTLAYDSHKKESEAHEKLVAVDQSKTTQSWLVTFAVINFPDAEKLKTGTVGGYGTL